ncbi:MAG: LamG-like jellyroll fold domain-containing protein [Saprospiraceae bacterium]
MKKNIYTLLGCLFSILISIDCATAQNSALHFDAVDNRVRISNNSAFNIGEQFTIEAWINASAWRPESWQGSIVTKDEHPGTGFAFRAGKNGTLSFVMGADNNWNEIASQPQMNIGQWHHVAAVVDGDQMRLFIDGEQAAAGSHSGTPTHNLRPVFIGESVGFEGRLFDGVIDDLRIWSIARTPAQLVEFSEQNLIGDEEGLVAYFPMNEGMGMTTRSPTTPPRTATLQFMEESDWVTGYSFPSIDVGITKISDPDLMSITSRPVRFRGEIKNQGEDPVTDIPIAILLNGDVLHRQVVSGTLASDERMTFTTEKLFDLTTKEQRQITIQTELDGDTNPLNDAQELNYPTIIDQETIRLVDGVQHNFGSAGQTQFTNLIMPYDWSNSERLLMHISVDCPSSGCDPWDQPAFVSVLKNGEEFEIARFITPYRKACGPWTVDVTDFKNLLTGEVALKTFIQVFGNSGWLLNIDLEVTEGTTLPYQQLNLLWGENYWVYGDPAISYDLPEKEVQINTNTQAAHFRLTMSGHGQGNTNNAAEFSNHTHQLMAGGMALAEHNLWNDDCDQNACDNQQGTWLFSRAGWCPGQAVNPFVYNLTNQFIPGTTLAIDYELQEYTNFQNTGYNNGSHTEPHYRIWGYLVEESDTRFSDFNNLAIENIAVDSDTTNGVITYNSLLVTIKNTGNQDVADAQLSYRVEGEEKENITITETITAGTSLVYEFTNLDEFDPNVVYTIQAIVAYTADENLNDDAAMYLLNGELLTSTIEVENNPIAIFPNPTTGTLQIDIPQDIRTTQLRVLDVQGKVVELRRLTDSQAILNIAKAGLYVVEITDELGRRFVRKVSVVK